MKFYEETKPLYIETDASGIALRAALLQTRGNTSCLMDGVPDNSILRPIAFASKILTSMENRYRNIEREALSMLFGLKKFHHYCIAREVSIITDQKPLVVIFKKDVEILSQRLQHILLRIHQYRVSHIQALTRPIYGGLALQTKPQGKQRCRNTCHANKY